MYCVETEAPTENEPHTWLPDAVALDATAPPLMVIVSASILRPPVHKAGKVTAGAGGGGGVVAGGGVGGGVGGVVTPGEPVKKRVCSA